VKLVTNPILIRMAIALLAAAFAFVTGILLMKRVRRSVQGETSLGEGDPTTGAFPLHTYHAVIQQLKQQKHELQSLQQAERRRAKTTENVSAAVLSNLSSGVLFFNTAGLVRQANAAARQILGFASPLGMNAGDLFRQATVQGSAEDGAQAMTVAEAVGITLHNATALRRLESDYETPSGEVRVLEITVSPVYASNAELLGGTCLINDQTEMAHMRRRQELRGDVSAEMALALRNSLTTISGYAKSLAANRDTNTAAQLALDIAAEAEHLDKTIGGFLAGAKAPGAASGIG
jgi:nitrogen fixation/metabolism regulation signal transduction histidine kinase